MMSGHSHCARNYFLRGWMCHIRVEHTALQWEVQWTSKACRLTLPHLETLFLGGPMTVPEGSSLHLSWCTAVSTLTSGMWHSRFPIEPKATACSEIQMLAGGNNGKMFLYTHPVSLVPCLPAQSHSTALRKVSCPGHIRLCFLSCFYVDSLLSLQGFLSLFHHMSSSGPPFLLLPQ